MFGTRAPKFTQKDVVGLAGKVYLVTGSTSGIGLELCKVLYSKHATVFLAGRNHQNGEKAISEIQSASLNSKGTLKFIYVDLSDLSTIRPAAEEILAQAERLDVVWHNAGVAKTIADQTKQGLELNLCVNTIAPWLLQSFLTPLMSKTSEMPSTQKDTVRVIWVGSSGHSNSPRNGGILWEDINFQHGWHGNKFEALLRQKGTFWKYGQSKTANIAMGLEAAKRWAGKGVLSLTADPGWITDTNIQQGHPKWVIYCTRLFMHPIEWGSINYLFAGISPEISEERYNGKYIIPWCRIGTSPRDDINRMLPENGEMLWEYCEEVCKDYMR
ncbi:NAD(P)-binding protein [Morchella conica CCBAS932]|uniref:NAD(P)-binding protein n=1 Tax=Morchella conica CCBAS932 TaxID=1392247 RepID=A0A3N4KAU9_9PEZI|nr:NAD(P)-binding protein [Morchella conica CCBAS932]